MRTIVLTAVASVLISMNVSGAADHVRVKHVPGELDIAALDSPAWSSAPEVAIETYWSGRPAPQERSFRARLLWSVTALYVRFEAEQHEPLIVSETPELQKKVRGLWDRDVCEIFIAPDRRVPGRYFEFEIAPNGEWIDLGIEVLPSGRKTDAEFRSGMTSAARVEQNKIVMAIKIPFAALGRKPKTGDIWLGNLFRCVGKGPTRGYLAWRPTKTEKPAFHVPKAFGEFRFVK